MDIFDVLAEKNIEYKKTNNPNEILVKCTSGEHIDKSPSLSYNIEKNIFNCWSCGFRGGKSKFLESIGIETKINLETKQSYKIVKLRNKIKKYTDIANINIPEDYREIKREFKGIHVDTFKNFNAFVTNQGDLADYLCIPVYQYQKLKFIEGRLKNPSESKPKYFRQPAHAKVKEVLFPIDKIKNTNKAILVEGIFDMLNMHQLGYTNTLCIFGANNFGKEKIKLLDDKGINFVYILMDSDTAGLKAAQKIYKLLDTANIIAKICKLETGIDPGSATKQQIEEALYE